MNNPGLFQAKWNLGGGPFAIYSLSGCWFWLWPTGQMLCVLFDEWLFHLFNDPLASNPVWLHVWAVASLRPFDAVVGVILLMLLIRGDWVFKAVQVRQAFFWLFRHFAAVAVYPHALFQTGGADGLAAQQPVDGDRWRDSYE